jgi:arylsulfatase A-like enzyme
MGMLRQWLADSGHRQNTLLWYCSDNGGLPEQGSTGGRAAKGSVYQGGLRVPAIIEWPAAIPEARVTDAPCVTSDIGPTLLDTLGLPPLTGRPLDGVSLRPLVEGGRIERPGIGFWHYPAQGIPVYSERWMAELLEAQRAGEDLRPPDQVRADAGEIEVSYPEGDRRGHAAWRDGDWKLHRISGDDDEDHIELYNLVSDPMESTDLASSERARAHRMLLQLERWQASVVGSMNGEDYG